MWLADFLRMLDQADKALLVKINTSGTPFWDTVMIFLTEKFVWIPFYFLLVLMLWFKFKKRIWLVLLSIASMITAADQFASTLMKPWVGRLRPCHEPTIHHLLHLAKGCGGTYGFISSHAANTFALACFVSLLFKDKRATLLLFIWCSSVSFSRIYLGAHYPGDIAGGAVAGMMFGVVFYFLFKLLYQKLGYHTNGLHF